MATEEAVSDFVGSRLGGALVTGAGRGLGREIARALIARGHAVHVTDIDLEAAERTATELGDCAFASALDVSDEEACRAAASITALRCGSLAVWVNNAGILPLGYAWENDADERRLTFDVNTFGTINGTLAALELMRPAGKGHVLNVVSLAGIVTAPGENLYAATKHASMAFTIGTGLDLKSAGIKGVHVSALCPDGIWTPMLHERVDDPRAAASWAGTFLQPEEVANKAMGILDKPKPVTIVPRWRGPLLRFFDAFPRVSTMLLPVVMADARRKQKRWKKQNPRPQ